MTKKIKLSFVNDGKEFILPAMTVEKQELLMEEMVPLEKDIAIENRNREMNKRMVLNILKEIDDTVTLDQINKMHPDDYIFLFTKIWNSGKELTKSDEKDFR